MIAFGERDLIRHFGPRVTEAGRSYYRQGRVVDFARDGDTIRSAVRGSARTPYRQTVTLTEARAGIGFAGRCNCPVLRDCKHVVAALFHALTLASVVAARTSGNQGRPAVSPGAGAASPAPGPEPGLTGEVAAWLDQLARVSEAADDAYPPGVAKRLVYVLQPVPDAQRLPLLGVQTVVAQLRKDGTFAPDSRPYQDQASSSTPPKYIRSQDRRVLRDLERLPRVYTRSMHVNCFTDDLGAGTLSNLLATGRARWKELNGPALSAGPARSGDLSWVADDAGRLTLRLAVEGGGLLLAAMPPVYVDPAAGLVGPVETGLRPAIAAALLRAPPLAAADSAPLHASLARRLPALAGFAPPAAAERRTGLRPVPGLRLFTAPMPTFIDLGDRYGISGMSLSSRESVALARLSFRYGDAVVPSGATGAAVALFTPGGLVEIARDAAAEAEAGRRLAERGFTPAPSLLMGVPPAHAHDLMPGTDSIDWFEALHDTLPALAAAGWAIEIAPDFPFRLLRADGPLDAELREGSGPDWLDLHLGVTVDGERVDLVEPLIALIASPDAPPDVLEGVDEADSTVFVPLPDGRALAMPLARLRPIVAAMRELAFGTDRGSGHLRLSQRDAARLAAFESATAEAALRWQGGEAVRALGRKLTAAEGVPPVAVPPGFLAVLRPYQAAGVAWLSLLREVGLGGILADDMGLGKTVQALAFLAIEKAEGRLVRPALVVAPTSLMANWAREAERFAPELKVLVLHGPDRKALFDAIPAHDLVLTTYPLVARDHAVLAGHPWHVLLLDEAQTIKNPDATTTRLILGLEARHRFCLTGTPLENNLAELWSLFSFACPGLLGDRKAFAATWRTPIEKTGDVERGRLLARRLRPFLLRRTKDEVARDLPPKTEIVESVALAAGQREIYDSIRLSMHERIRKAIADKGWERSRIEVLDALLKLRQACCDPRLLKLRTKGAAAAGSAKLERLEAMLTELLAEGRRVIVFSQFTSMLDLIGPRLDALGIRYALLTGSTRDRPAAIAAFDGGAVPVFLISLKAGGVGLNLVSADTVVLYDPWWNPAVEAQAVDRAHRIGQTKPVFVHKLVAADTIEDKMEILKQKKAALAASLFDHDGEPTLAMTEADIQMLLAP